MAEWLLRHGAALDERESNGATPLLVAACGGSLDLVRFFVSKGALLTECNTNGDTALLLAAYCGHVRLVDWLLHNGAVATESNEAGNISNVFVLRIFVAYCGLFARVCRYFNVVE